MASSIPDPKVCWLIFYGMPASDNHEPLAGQLVKMLGGRPMRVVRTELSEVEVVTLLVNPDRTVPMELYLYVSHRKYRITIDVSETPNEMQEAVMRMVLESNLFCP